MAARRHFGVIFGAARFEKVAWQENLASTFVCKNLSVNDPQRGQQEFQMLLMMGFVGLNCKKNI